MLYGSQYHPGFTRAEAIITTVIIIVALVVIVAIGIEVECGMPVRQCIGW